MTALPAAVTSYVTTAAEVPFPARNVVPSHRPARPLIFSNSGLNVRRAFDSSAAASAGVCVCDACWAIIGAATSADTTDAAATTKYFFIATPQDECVRRFVRRRDAPEIYICTQYMLSTQHRPRGSQASPFTPL